MAIYTKNMLKSGEKMENFFYFCDNLTNYIFVVRVLAFIFSAVFCAFYSVRKGIKFSYGWVVFLFALPLTCLIAFLIKGKASSISAGNQSDPLNATEKSTAKSKGKAAPLAICIFLCLALSVTAIVMFFSEKSVAISAKIGTALYNKYISCFYGVPFEGKYYDRDGNEYERFADVPLFMENGEKLLYNKKTNLYESDKRSLSAQGFSVNGEGYAVLHIPTADYIIRSGKRFLVDYDELEKLGIDSENCDLNDIPQKYRYYPCPLVGWNKDGELIFEEGNDKAFYYEMYIDK